VLIAVAWEPSGTSRLMPVDDAGRPAGPVAECHDIVGEVRAAETRGDVRWLWASTADVYPVLVRAGVRVARCHDLELVEGLLVGAEGNWGAPRSLASAYARATGAPIPPDPPARSAAAPGDSQEALFDAEVATIAPPGFDALTAILTVYRGQLERIAATPAPGRFRLLAAAESAGGLLAVEMGIDGLPWSARVHDEVLADLLGEPGPMGTPPTKVAALAADIVAAFGGSWFRVDSPAELLKAFHRAGFSIGSTRMWELRSVDHPAVPLILRYKELYRIWTAHGWAWRQAWVQDGRFRPEYVPGGVVSGRWATRGGGALQIPKVIRSAVRADPGRRLIVSDAGQLEPRILAACSGDTGMMRAAGAGDMYAALAQDAFGGDRAKAKVALLGAMYGQTGGQAVPALAALKKSYPVALEYVEEAARAGEAGALVRSWLGRTCPPPSASWDGYSEDADARGGAYGRARGRFTRNFVIQATAAEWALALLATLRTSLAGTDARLVFFQHDEVIVHAPEEIAATAAAAVQAAGEQATRLLFGATSVRFPLGDAIVESYADAK
jgi:DNA polymerase family A